MKRRTGTQKEREDAQKRVKQEMVGRFWRLVGRSVSSNSRMINNDVAGLTPHTNMN